MPDILVVGSLNADLVVRAPRFPQPGETISGEDLQVIPGGKGANQAVAAARLGANVAMLGCVGNDAFGDLLLENLKANHVDINMIKRESGPTGTAMIVIDASGQNSIVLSPGANYKVSYVDINRNYSSFPDQGLLLLQLEILDPAFEMAAHSAKRKNMTVILNPAPAKNLNNDFLSTIDFIVPNEAELSLLTGMEVKDIPSAEKAAEQLLQRGAKNVIVTLGSKGALVVTGKQGDKYTNTRADTFQVNTFKVNVVDTTAAGDAFIGGFATKLLESDDLLSAVRYGCACGALATTKFGAQPSLPTKQEVERFMALQRAGSNDM
jgi:ribokinase